MYTVYCDGQLLFDPRVDELKITDKKLSLEVNKAGAFDFTIYPSHALYDNIYKLKSIIEVYQDNVLIFRGRPLDDDVSFYNARRIQCESELAYFNDSIQRPYEYSGTIQGYLELLISNHNTQVDSSKRFAVGKVTVTDSNDFITRADSSYPKTWDVIKSKLIDLLGGYIVVRRENDVNYIDYLVDSPYMTAQEIELGNNLLDVKRERKGHEIATAIIPIGATIEDEEGNESKLDITSVNDGVDYVYDQAAVDVYGWIFKTVEFDDVTIANNLLTKGQQALADAIQTTVNVELKAIDKSMQDVDIDELQVFEYVTVKSEPHELNESYLIKKLTLDMENPANNSITIGKTYKTFTDQKIASDETIRNIKADYVTNQKLTEVKSSVDSLSSSIEQTAEDITFEVSQNYVSKNEFATYETDVGTEFKQTKESFDFSFKTLETTISDVDGDAKKEFEEIKKYIRFVDGNIELGESDSDVMLVIENDAVTFKQNDVAVGWFEDNNLYIKDGRFLNSIRIGDFQFTPRSNGNLSFGKVT